MGRAIALALAAKGASVAVSDLNIERADRTAEAIRAAGGAPCALRADVSNRFQVANMIEQARDAFGGIDILVNAVAILHAQPLLDVDEWSWRRQIEVNITGTFFCMQLVARVMADEGGGCIINLAPDEAGVSSLPAGIGYIAGGAGVIGMTRQAARELAPHRIRVNCISTQASNESKEKVASAALFLCSDAAQSLTGHVLQARNGDPFEDWLAAAK